MQECALTPSDFAVQRNVSPQHINNWFTRGIPLARLDEIADLFCVYPRWLKSGEGPKHPDPILRPRPTSRTPPSEAPPLLKDDGRQRRFQLQRFDNGAFTPVAAHHLSLPQRALDALGIKHQDVLCLAMPAHNMAPVIPCNAVLAIDRGFTRVEQGETYAVLHQGRLRIHHLSLGDHGVLSLHSHDRLNYPTERFSAAQRRAQDLHILGWVFWYAHLREGRPG